MPDTPPPSLRSHGFQILETELHFAMEAFATVLKQLGEPELAASLPWVGSQAPGRMTRSLGQAYSIAFQLLNIVEERAAAQVRRLREKEKGPEAEKGLWADNLHQLRSLGLGEAEILAALHDIRVEPVLTAHPTEAKRETVRDLHREIYSLMNRHENPAYTPREKDRLEGQLRTRLESLWRTGEIHVTRPSIEAELQNALYYLREVFPEALARAHTHLREAWTAAGYDAAAIDSLPPLLRFGSWIGGDRDGHPFVTAEVTAHALVALRKNGLRVQRRALEALAFQLPLSSLFQVTPPALTGLIESLAGPLRSESHIDLDYLIERNREEPWRLAVYLMRARVLLALEKPDSPAAYVHPAELRHDIDALADTLLEIGADAVVEEQIVPFRRNLAAFGFHSAALDVRQN